MREFREFRVKPEHPYAWLWEPLEEKPSFAVRAMFGAQAVYVDGRLQFCFTAKEEPWRGVLVCTDRANHETLLAEFPSLAPHPVLPKWLYLPEASSDFESTVALLVRLVKNNDHRIGVVAKEKTKPKRAKGRPRRSKRE